MIYCNYFNDSITKNSKFIKKNISKKTFMFLKTRMFKNRDILNYIIINLCQQCAK